MQLLDNYNYLPYILTIKLLNLRINNYQKKRMKNTKYKEIQEWRNQCKRQLKRTLRERLDFGFVYTYKPVLDDASFRIFDSVQEYRKWCSKNLPSYLGYKVNEKRRGI